VAVGIEYEGPVVGRVVLLAQPRRAVVAPAGGEGGGVEGVDRLAVVAGEGDVRAGAERLALDDPERRLALRPESGRVLELHHDAVPERGQRQLVEAAARGVVLHVQGDVVEHRRLPSLGSNGMILENGVIRTLDPALPLARALA